MRKQRLSFVLAVSLLLHLLSGAVAAIGIDSSLENFSIDYYEYPIDIDSPDWFDYTVSENVEKLRIPEQILRRMTNTALVTAIHEFPYVCDLYLYNDSIEDGFTSMLSYCSALSELSSRELDADTLASLAAPFVEITANSATECSLDFFVQKQQSIF